MNREEERAVRSYERVESFALCIYRQKIYAPWTKMEKWHAYLERRKPLKEIRRQYPNLEKMFKHTTLTYREMLNHERLTATTKV